MNSKKQLDAQDLCIIRILRADARATISDIAQECGMSRAAVRQRVNKLLQEGVITQPTFFIDPYALGFGTCAYIQVFHESTAHFRQVLPQLEAIPEIIECHLITGRANNLMKVYARDNAHLAQIISKIQEVTQSPTETLISLERTFVRSLDLKLIPTVDNQA